MTTGIIFARSDGYTDADSARRVLCSGPYMVSAMDSSKPMRGPGPELLSSPGSKCSGRTPDAIVVVEYMFHFAQVKTESSVLTCRCSDQVGSIS